MAHQQLRLWSILCVSIYALATSAQSTRSSGTLTTNVTTSGSNAIDDAFELIYSSSKPVTGANGDTFAVQDPLLNKKASCSFMAPRVGNERPTRIPLQKPQPCTPDSFQFQIIAYGNPCGLILELSHAISNANGSINAVKKGQVTVPCASNSSIGSSSSSSSPIIVHTNITNGSAGQHGDVYSPPPSNITDYSDLDTTYKGPSFVPTDTLNNTIVDQAVLPGQFPVFFGCVCNQSYVSYACCDAKDGIVNEPSEKLLGHLENASNAPGSSSSRTNSSGVNGFNDFANVDVKTPSITAGLPQATNKNPTNASSAGTTGAEQHHICSGFCYGAARTCSYGFVGDCMCSVSWNILLFWKSGACIATEQNPNKQHDKRHLPAHPSLKLGPYIDPSREVGICNESYISHACAHAPDGIVHEPLSNWLGAMLPEGATEYPPIPQEFLAVHGIKGQPDLGPFELR